MFVTIHSCTDIGHGRDNNEDSLAYCPDLSSPSWHNGTSAMEGAAPVSEAGTLLIVADGMGGADAGEVASATAMDAIKTVFEAHGQELTTADAETLFREAIAKAQEAIMNHTAEHPDTAGMGTTVVMAWLRGEAMHVAWCGDSRAYLFNDRQGLKPLTTDHSLVQQLVDEGMITPEEARTHPDSHIITRGLGEFDEEPLPDIVSCTIASGDTIMLCSDGLSAYCTDKEIAQALTATASSSQDKARCLTDLALGANSDDNISVITATLQDTQAATPSHLRRFLKGLFR